MIRYILLFLATTPYYNTLIGQRYLLVKGKPTYITEEKDSISGVLLEYSYHKFSFFRKRTPILFPIWAWGDHPQTSGFYWYSPEERKITSPTISLDKLSTQPIKKWFYEKVLWSRTSFFLWFSSYEGYSDFDKIKIRGQHLEWMTLFELKKVPSKQKYLTHEREMSIQHIRTQINKKHPAYTYYSYRILENKTHYKLIFCPQIGIISGYKRNFFGIKTHKLQLKTIQSLSLEEFLTHKQQTNIFTKSR